MLRFTVSVAVAMVLLIPLASVVEATPRVQEIVICKSPAKDEAGKTVAGRPVRTLRIYETKEKNENGESTDGCRATYTKTTVEQTVGTSSRIQQCQSILTGIQKNLEASNWNCRKAGPMAIMRSSAAEASEAMVDARAPVKEETVVR